MDLPITLQQTIAQPNRARSHTSCSTHSTVNSRGAIQKRSIENDRSRSISLSQAQKLYQFAAEQQDQLDREHSNPLSTAGGIQWITPQHSPHPQAYQPEPVLESFPEWTAPTPPHSDSGLPTVSLDSADKPVTADISVTPEFAFEQPSAEMSSLGFLLPSTYGSSPYESDSNDYTAMDQNYIPPMRITQPSTTSGTSAYAPTIPSTSSPSAYQHSRPNDSESSRRASEMPPTSSAGQTYDHYRRVSSPYDTAYTMGPSQTIPSISGLTHNPLPSPHLSSTSNASMMAQYNRSPNMYDTNPYSQSYTTTPAPSTYANPTYPSPFIGSTISDSTPKPISSNSTPTTDPTSVRVLNNPRPKPQCWEHGCNGRQFSTFSNLLRHQREKSGTAAKSYCPKCGAEFTRTTARNGHLAHDKCTKMQRRESEDGGGGSGK